MIKSIRPIFETPETENYFFGYYDKSPLDISSTMLLALRVNFVDRIPEEGDIAEIGYFSLIDKKKLFVHLTETKTFNWQQGCMLQWLGPECKSKIIYNDLHNKKYISVIYDINNGKKKILPMSVYSVSSDGKFALCIDNERHHFCRRGYSYAGVKNKNKNKNIVPGDGVWYMNLTTGSVKQVIKLSDLIKNNYLSNMDGAVHYVEHLMLNTKNNSVCFLHRWKMDGGGIYSRLYTSDVDGENLYLLNDSGRMSHYCWRNEKEILGYGGLVNTVNKLRKHKSLVKYLFRPLLPLYHKIINDTTNLNKILTGDSYILFTDKTSIRKRVAKSISSEDGHPSFFPNNKNLFITDTYPDPDEGSVAQLIQYDLSIKKETILTELNSIPNFDNTPIRCDLHPKISYDGNYVSVDTMDKGVRSIYLYRM